MKNRTGNLGYWLSGARAEFPDRTALIDLSRPTPREVTYRELDERMDRVANLLTDAGVAMGERVALSVGNRFEFVEIMFGAMRCGAVPVPLNFKLSAESLAHIVADAGCTAAFVETAVTARSAQVIERLGIEKRWEVGGNGAPHTRASTGWVDYEGALAGSSPDFEPPRLPAVSGLVLGDLPHTAAKLVDLSAEEVSAEAIQLDEQTAVSAGCLGLAFQRPKLAANFPHHIGQPG